MGSLKLGKHIEFTRRNVKLYHGTDKKFDKFDDRYLSGMNFGPGFYFANDFDTAKWFCHGKDESGGYVYECALKASNPFNIRDSKHAKLVAEKIGINWNTVKADKSYRDAGSGYDHPADKNEFYKKMTSVILDMMGETTSKVWNEMHGQIHQAVKDLGFDSIIDERHGYVMVFRASQVKILKTHKVGEYDPEAARKFWDR